MNFELIYVFNNNKDVYKQIQTIIICRIKQNTASTIIYIFLLKRKLICTDIRHGQKYRTVVESCLHIIETLCS